MSSTHSSLTQLRARLAALLMGVALLTLSGNALALTPRAALLADYQLIHPELLHNPYGVPVYVRSREQNDLLMAEVYGKVDYPLAQLEAALAAPSGWCDTLALTLNVKACVHDERDGQQWLTLYMGRKFYQPPAKAYQARYRFRTIASRSDYFEVSLSAADGPMGTHDYRTVLQAVAVRGGTLLHIRSAYRSSTASRWATSIYLATLGKGKIGFSPAGIDKDGRHRYVEGVRGAIERNTMRYYLALEAVLATRALPVHERFDARIQRWFALTERYHPQLYEMDRAEYLQAKRREHINQQRLQELQAPASGQKNTEE
ncbi:MAG: hypothetical protein P8164_13695 [Gammaproteobacteria bacterium]